MHSSLAHQECIECTGMFPGFVQNRLACIRFPARVTERTRCPTWRLASASRLRLSSPALSTLELLHWIALGTSDFQRLARTTDRKSRTARDGELHVCAPGAPAPESPACPVAGSGACRADDGAGALARAVRGPPDPALAWPDP